MRRTSTVITALLALLTQSVAASEPPSAASAFRTTFAATVVLEGNELFVGRPGISAFFPMPPDHAGTVHIFARDGAGTWTERARIGSSSATIEDGFAVSLAVRGNIMAVGAPLQNGGRGAVYIFERTSPAGAWQEVAHLTDASSSENDQLGSAVAVTGETVLAGVPGRTNGRGAVIVFRKAAAGWARAAVIESQSATAGDRFGTAISADGTRALIGAPGPLVWMGLFGGQPPRPGAAFIFARDATGAWREEARLASGSEPATLGATLHLSGDEALVSAPLAAGSAGAIVRFTRGTTGWAEAGRFSARDAQPGTLLGMSLSRAGNDLIAGAPMLHGVGAVFVFRRGANGEWSQVQQLDGTQNFGFFGGAIAALNDLAVIGAPGADFFEGKGVTYRRNAAGEWSRVNDVMTEETRINAITGGQRDCTQGKVEPFTCSGVDLVAFLPIKDIGGERGVHVNDLWGWTDPQTGREYAIVGRNNGTSFVDVTDGANPRYLGDLPLHAGATPNVWRDMKVVRDHAFIVSDGAGPHGMQVFDLRQLRDVRNAPVKFTETAHYDRIASAHNIVANEQSGFVFIVGGSMGGETCGGGLHMVDVRDPGNPRFAGCFSDTRTGNARTGYSHDAQCINYNGPDEKYRGREICFGANETALSISDVTDKSKPVAISTAAYPNSAYLHQGWVSDDHRYLFMDDEGDELAGTVKGTRTLVWDIQDLDDPVLAKEYIGVTPASDHNLYVKGNYVFESNYVSGLRILDITDPRNPREVAFFDTVPWGKDAPGFAGSWSNYPFFRSGNIVVTSMREGLFILKQSRPVS
jgi:choice-of-anchor B domain-containing protein